LLFFVSGMVHQCHATHQLPRFGSFDTLIRPTPLAMSLVVRDSHWVCVHKKCPRVHVAFARACHLPRGKLCAGELQGVVICEIEGYLGREHTPHSLRNSQAIPVISSPAMFFFHFLSSSDFSVVTASYNLYFLGIVRLLHFFSQDVSRDLPPSVSVVCGAHLDSHTPPPFFIFMRDLLYGIARVISPLPPRLIRIAQLLGPPGAILLNSDA